MKIMTQKRRELLSTRLSELGNYTIASLFISQFLGDDIFNIPVSIGAVAVGILFHIAGLLMSS